MSNAVRVPIVDVTGKQTHVWKNLDESISTPSRTAGLSAPAPSIGVSVMESEDPLTVFESLDWDSMSLADRKTHTAYLMNDLFEEHGLEDWSYRNSRSYNALGQCFYMKKTIELSSKLIEHGTANDVKLTALHEIAHALSRPEDKHNRNWQRKCLEIGGDGQRVAVVVNLPTAPGGKKEAYHEGKLINVFIGDTVRAWDGAIVLIDKINRVTFHGISEDGVSYSFRYPNIERYKDDYERINGIGKYADEGVA